MWKEVSVCGGAVTDLSGLKGGTCSKGSRDEEEQKMMDSC